MMMRLLLLLLSYAASAKAFFAVAPFSARGGGGGGGAIRILGQPKKRSGATAAGSSSSLLMVKFNGEKWVAEKPEETGEAGYPLLNTWFLHGPKPFFTRIFQPDDYEQAVLKFMAGDKCDRQTAMGNMDAYLNNPNDWAFGRLEQKKRGIKYDYVTLDQKQVVLVTVWSLLIGFFIGRGIYSYIFNVPYDDFMKWHL